MSHLVSYSQIESNLRRTASNGLISLLNQKQLEDLAFKYFGIKDEYRNITGYQCPYSGKIYTNYKDIVLEHIVPVNSKGGTVLFNCIPTSKEVNGANQKGAKHLISWWTHSNYWDKDAPSRLEKIVNYMLDGYNSVFEEYTIEEVENSYLEVESDDTILDEEDDITYSESNESKTLKKQAKENGIHSYLGFILNCIDTLEKYNIDTTEIKDKLKSLEDKHIFEDIERYQLYQNIIQKIITTRIGNDNHSYLTYTLNFDISKLMNSINLDNKEEIYNEINSRLINIENLLKANNLSTIEYFKSLKDMSDINIIYKDINQISEEEISIFLENIKIGMDTKIEIFINMLNKGNSEILKQGNKENLEGYPNIKLSRFWNCHKEKIVKKLFIELKDNQEYNIARKLVENYNVLNNTDRKIEIFINMLNKGNNNILKNGNKENLEGYPNIKLSNFWYTNKDKINHKLFIELKDDPKYNTARQLIVMNEIIINKKIQIPIFIDMLNKGNSEILKQGNKETLEGYPYIKLSHFYYIHQDKIKKILFEELKDNPEYDTARKLIDINEMTINIENQIPIFINMLNQGNSKILKSKNNETLEGYPNINLSYFYQHYKDKIKKILFEELKDNSEYDTARKLIDTNEMTINIENQIPIFIDMLNQGNSEMLKFGNNEILEGYQDIKLSRFWSRYKEKIIKYLFIDLKDNPEYDIARKLVENYNVSNDIDKKIKIFINMLNKGNDNILKTGNKETLNEYPDEKISNFWQRHKEKIMKKLFIELKDNPEYDIARNLVENYNVSNDIDKKIKIFINMLNKGNDNILKTGNKETLDGYSGVKLANFWNAHKEKIMKKLFIELKDNPEYDTARKLIDINEMTINIENQIPIFINMLNKGNNNILKNGNKETLDGYTNIKLSNFWNSYKEKIKQKLFIELKDNPEYDTARKLIDINEMTINIENQIPIFIDMLNKGNDKILKKGNKETLEGYPNISLSRTWGHHKEKIIQKLFVELKDNHEHNTARQTILRYFKVSTIEEYYQQLEEKQRKAKQLKELKKLKNMLEDVEKNLDEEENKEHRKRA